MPHARRRFLLLSLKVLLAARLEGAFATPIGPKPSSAPAVPPALRRYLDTLLPGGEAPAATSVGVDKHILQKAGNSFRYRRLLRLGCRWLDRGAVKHGAKSFEEANQADREQIVANATAMLPGTLPRRFFERTRADAIEHYYAQPAVWAWLGYPGPPQPRGFMDHHRAPPTGTHEG